MLSKRAVNTDYADAPSRDASKLDALHGRLASCADFAGHTLARLVALDSRLNGPMPAPGAGIGIGDATTPLPPGKLDEMAITLDEIVRLLDHISATVTRLSETL